MRGWLVALVAWCTVFTVPHVVWAAGGRAGLGATAADADAAFATPWFAAYNAVTVLLCLAGVALGAADLSGRTRLAMRFRRVLLVLGAVLGLRGLVGVAGLVLDAATTGSVSSPPVLVAVEGWFLLGAVVLLGLARAARDPARRAAARGPTRGPGPR